MCELSLLITPGDAKCLQYRQSGSDTCGYCDFIPGAEVITKSTEPKRLRKGDKFTCPECRRENATYESGGLCGLCNSKRRKEMRAAKAEIVVPDYTCLSCGKDYFAQVCNECPFCGFDHVELVPVPVTIPAAVYPDLDAEVSANFGKVTNAEGDQVSFGVDPLVLANIRRTLKELEQHMVVDLSGVGFFQALDYLQNVRHGMAREVQ